MEDSMKLTGLYVPAITQFGANEEVELNRVQEWAEILIQNGVDGIVAVGTTGEAYALSLEERAEVAKAIVKQVAGRVPVLAGVGGMSTREAIAHAVIGKEAGCEGLMIASPAYSVPTQDEIATHMNKVVAAAGIPAVLYDYPGRIGVSIEAEALDVLADNPLITGIKEASGDLTRIDMLKKYEGRIEIVCGADVDSVSFLAAGATSWIAGAANALPKAHLGILDPATRDEAYAAVKPLLENVESGRYIAKTKALMSILGVPSNNARGPLKPLEESGIEELRALVAKAGDWAPSLV
jgi:4-hydroxy-tetrahydrodipicolinate synthase